MKVMGNEIRIQKKYISIEELNYDTINIHIPFSYDNWKYSGTSTTRRSP